MKPLPLRVIRRFKHIGLLLLLAVTAYVTLGRLLMPLVATRKDTIEIQLANAIGVPVGIGDIKGSWFRFGPSIAITDLRIGDPAGTAPMHRIERIELVLDVPASLLAHQPVVSRISATKLALTVQERDDGKWGLAGVPAQGGGNADPLIDFLLSTNVLTLNESEVVLLRRNGQRVALTSLILGVENSFNTHEARMQVRVGEQVEPSHLTLQLHGDPRRSFSVSAWLDTGRLDLLPLLQPQLPADWQWQQLQGHGRFWLDADSNGVQNFAAELEDVNVDARHHDQQHQLALQHGALKLSARPVYGKDDQPTEWKLRVQDVGFDWQNRTWSLDHLQALSSHAPALRWTLQADAINLAMVSQVVSAAVPMPAAGQSALDTLAPSGVLRNVVVDTAFDGSYPQLFRLRGNLDQVAVGAWQQAPSGSGLTGYVEATAAGGFAEVDSQDLTLHLPLLFTNPWHFDRVNTRVSWQADRDAVRVQSNIIEAENAGLSGRVRFDVNNVRDDGGHWHNEFTLQIGMQRMQVAQAPDFLPTLASVRDTMDWLRAALHDGELGESAFLLHTFSSTAHTVESPAFVGSWYRATGAGLKFLPQWPALAGTEALVVQRNNEVDVEARGGSIAGITIRDADARIRPFGDAQVLSVRADAVAPTNTGLDFLRNTPVHDTVGNFLDQWQAKGELALTLGLGLDLHDHGKPPLIRVETDTSDSELDMTEFDLQFRKVSGQVVYDSRQGLQAKALSATLFDNELKAVIATTGAGTPTQVIRMDGKGRAGVGKLQQWSGQPVFVRQLFNYTQGDVDYNATLTISQTPRNEFRETKLLIESDLVGLSSSLPSPLGKAKDQMTPLAVELGFGSEQRTLDFRYRDLLNGSLQLDSGGIQKGLVSIGARNRNFNVRQTDNNAAGVLVSGDLEQLDVMAWEEVAQAMNKAGGQGREAADYLRLVDVNVGKLTLMGRDFAKVNVVIEHPSQSWRISARNDMLSGNFEMPDEKGKPWKIALDYLRLPARPVVDKSVKNPPEEPDPLQDADPSKWPPFDFTTRELTEGTNKLGAFSFQFRPNALGASITNFRMQSPDAQISDVTGSIGATIDWHYMDGKHQSNFNGLFSASDLARVLPAWGHDANVVSDTARFDGALNWPGSPLHFSLKHASGQLRIGIQDGRFVDISAGSTRVIGALNFDSLVRRLKLDFSDIFSKGYSYDSIDGVLDFTDGVVTTKAPLRIDGPSTDLTIQGEINLRDETIAADMEVQIPVGQVISTGLALAGAWPIAVTTYLASKILKSQVNDFTTVIYRLEGPWEKPTTGFEPPVDEKDAKAAQSGKAKTAK